MPNLQVETAIRKSITNLIFGEPFIGSLLPKTEIILKPEDWFLSNGFQFATAGTDGTHIWCCEEFFEPLNDFNINAVLSHEVFHCLLLHFCRIGDRIPAKWNAACDYSLNPFVDEMPRCILPKGALLDEKYKGMTAERIYDLLEDDEWDEDMEIDIVFTPSDENTIGKEIEWRGAVAVAAEQAKQAGKFSADLEMFIELLLKPKMPWDQILYNFMVRPLMGKTDWNNLNRRYWHRGLKIPTRKIIRTGTFVISVDVSGSMSDKAIEQCLVEIQFVVNIVKPERVIIIEHDAQLKGKPIVYPRGQEMPSKFEIHGRGGTDFRPVFEYVDGLSTPPEAVVLLTDGQGPCPDKIPDYPVLWALCETDESLQMPFGEQLWID